ncbi:MAG: homoserine dehydrogenase, partial [Planctomycetes bacterium]|nr:homoserine dehydrogenase [Planctomycetota bacterium]
AILGDPEIGTVIHLVGGTTAARDLCLACIQAGKHVVTANKAMLAEHGDEIFAAAAAKGVGVAFEAAVAGGIPVIAAVRDGLVANRIEAIYAILNGTCNFILTKMELEGKGFAEALAEAQKLGYAEADPTLDVDGTDSAHKLALLARIAFNARIPIASVRLEGIQQLTFQDIRSAKTMNCRIKLLAAARQRPTGLELRVAPTLVPLEHPLADVSKNYNGIYVVSDAAGPTLLVGQGAGALPTASAVLADVVDVVSGRYALTCRRFAFFTASQVLAFVPENDEYTGSYARFAVPDRPGILAGITNVLSANGVSVLSIHQGEPDTSGTALIEVVTHPLRGGSFLTAVAEIDRTGLTLQPTVTLRRL